MSALERLLAGSRGVRIAEPEALVALLLAVLAAAIAGGAGILARRATLRRSFGELAAAVAPGASAGRAGARLALLCSGLALLAIAAARPQSGQRTAAVKVPGVNLAVVLDASQSMLARDVAPTRFAVARSAVEALLRRRPADRVAVVAFAGSAFLQCPLTSDHRAAALLLGAVDPSAMPRQGTSVAAALDAAARALAAGEGQGEGGARVVLLVTDGEDHDGGAADAADRLALQGVTLVTAGVGTRDGARVPRPDGLGFLTREGRPVISRLDADALRDLAARAGGRSFDLGADRDALDGLAAALSRAEDDASRVARVTGWDDRFDAFAATGLLLLVAASLAAERAGRAGARRTSPPRLSRRTGQGVAAACALLLLGTSPFLAEHAGLSAANALAARDPAAALELYDDVEREVGPRAEIDVDRGIALFRAGRVEEARRSFSLAMRSRGPLASRAAYADGVAALSLPDEDGAITAWRRALVLDPSNGAARHDLEVLLRRRAEERPKPPPDAGAESQPRGGDRPQRDPGAAARTPERPSGEAARHPEPGATGTEKSSAPGTDRTAAPARTAPMSRAEAERLLDAAAVGERVMPMAPAASRRAASAEPW